MNPGAGRGGARDYRRGMSQARHTPRLGFLHIVPFSADRPEAGLKDSIDLFRHAEALGFDSGWVRTRHLQYGAPAPAVVLTALAAATEHLELGSAVIPMEFENPFQFAENFSVADLLSGSRLRPGVSVHPPRFEGSTADLVFGPGREQQDYSYQRILTTLDLLRGKKIRDVEEYVGLGGDLDSETLQPLNPGLAERFSYGAGSLRSATWAGENGLGLLTSNISSAENGVTAFDEAVAQQMRAYREARGSQAGATGTGHVAMARVVLPLDGATPEQARRYRDYVERRTPRTRAIVGEKTLIAPDVIGSTQEIVETLTSNPAYAEADELIFELPFELEPEDWRHHLLQLATEVGPALGWTPSKGRTDF